MTLAWFDFTQMSSKPRAVTCSLVTNPIVFAGRERTYGICYSKWNSIHDEMHDFGNHLGHTSSKMALMEELQGNVSWTMCCFTLCREDILIVSGYGGWFTPILPNTRFTWVGSRSDRNKITNELHRSSLVAVTGPPLQEGTVRPFWHTPECNCYVYTGPNESHSSSEFNWADLSESREKSLYDAGQLWPTLFPMWLNLCQLLHVQNCTAHKRSSTALQCPHFNILKYLLTT